MKAFLLLTSTIISMSLARPEIPSNNYGPPSPPLDQYEPPVLQKQYGPPVPQEQYGPPVQHKQRGPPVPQEQYGPPVQQKQYGPPVPQEQYGPPVQQKQYGPPIPQYGLPSEYAAPQIEKQITKNVYVHIPPEEPAKIIPRQSISVPVPKTHYKIIFIKAPTPPTPMKIDIPEQPQDEHKTLVYVLVKNPEPQPLIDVPIPQTTESTKPEVYFIKYKDQEKLYQKSGPY